MKPCVSARKRRAKRRSNLQTTVRESGHDRHLGNGVPVLFSEILVLVLLLVLVLETADFSRTSRRTSTRTITFAPIPPTAAPSKSRSSPPPHACTFPHRSMALLGEIPDSSHWETHPCWKALRFANVGKRPLLRNACICTFGNDPCWRIPRFRTSRNDSY